MFREKITNYFIDKSLECWEKDNWKGWRRYLKMALYVADEETKMAIVPVLLQWLDDTQTSMISKLSESIS